MHHLVPRFIHDQYQAENAHGRFEAVTLFLDISGFTSMTQSLMQHSKVGAEILSEIINNVFEPLIHAVYAHEGFIIGFAGDAFAAVFPDAEPSTALAVCKVTRLVQQFFAENGQQRTAFGDFDLAVKQGVALGQVEWGIVGPDNHKTFFFRGPGIDGCAAAEHQASPGDIILSQELIALLPQDTVTIDHINSEYGRLLDLRREDIEEKVEVSQLSSLEPATAEKFYTPYLFELVQPGEFRDVVCVFISFQDLADLAELNRFVTLLVDAVDRYGGLFTRLDYGDKGGNILIFFGAPIARENEIERALDIYLERNGALNCKD